MNKHMKSYYDYTNTPWGKLFYQCVWEQLPACNGKNILDFGSGFGITANHLAVNNSVTAVEPSRTMIKARCKENDYKQLKGSVDVLKQIPDNTFDCIICHNVLEYIEKRNELLAEFTRILKRDGFISIVKHNKAGRIMQKAIFDYDIKSVNMLLDNRNLKSGNFGEINLYSDSSLEEYSDFKLYIEKVMGICTFYGLQNNDIKSDPKWITDMKSLEMRVSEINKFRDIAFFHHIILNKK